MNKLEKINAELQPVTDFINLYADPILMRVSQFNFVVIIVLVSLLTVLHVFFRDKETKSFKNAVSGFVLAVLVFAASAVGSYNVTQFFITPQEYTQNDLLRISLKVFQAFGTIYLIWWSVLFSKAIIEMLNISIKKEWLRTWARIKARFLKGV